MQEMIQNYAIFLDYLRNSYGFTEEALCDGICTTRAYRRYLTDERHISHERIMQFCKRLGISPNEFFYGAIDYEQKELRKIKDAFYLINDSKFEEARNKLDTIKRDRLVNVQNMRFLEFCVIKLNYRTNRIHISHAIDLLAKLIDYPKSLTRKAFDFVDMMVLNMIAELEIKSTEPKETALNRLREILTNKDLFYLSQDTTSLYPMIFANVSLYLGRLGRIEESKQVAAKGIDFARLYNNNRFLPQLFYLHTLGLLKQGYKEQAEIEALRCLSSLFAKGDKIQTTLYHKILTKDFGYDPYDLMSKYKDRLLENQT